MMADNFEVLIKSIEKLQSTSKQGEMFINTAKSTTELKNETVKLTAAQTELEKIQRQFATSTQRLSDEYISNKRAITAVNDEVKNKLSLGDRDARQVTAQNSSMKVLQAALEKNRKAYADLNTEHARTSKTGEELLKIIQSQDKQFKELNASMGKHQENVGNYKEAVEVLNEKMEGWLGKIEAVGHQLTALAATPFIAVATVLVGLFIALKEAAEDYYKGTFKGEEMLREEEFKSAAVLREQKGFWRSLGAVAAETWKFIKDSQQSNIIAQGNKELAHKMELAEEAAKLESKNIKDHIREVVEDAQTELEVNTKLEQSRDKINLKVKERQEALKEAVHLLELQLARHLELAQNELHAEELRLASLGKQVIQGKLVKDYTEEDFKATKTNTEQLTKYAELQAKLFKLEAEAAEKRKGFHRWENSMHEENLRDEKAAYDELLKNSQDTINAEQDAAIKIAKTKNKEAEDSAHLRTFLNKDVEKNIVDDTLAAQKIVDDAVKESFKDEKEASDEFYDHEMENIEREKEARLGLLDIIGRAADATRDAIGVLLDYGATVAQARIATYNKELKTLENNNKKEILMAGDNAAAKDKIDLEYQKKKEELEKKIAEEKNKQAKIQRAADIVDAGVTFAKAILAALAGGPPPFNLALAEITAAVAGAQLAAISSAPIPQFEKGGVSEGGLAIVGEGGVELMRRGNEFSLSPSGASLVNLEKGTEIIPHEETMRMLAMSAIGTETLVDRENIQLQREVRELQNIMEDVGGKIVDAVSKGNGNIIRQGTLAYQMQKQKDGSAKMIRLKNLSE